MSCLGFKGGIGTSSRVHARRGTPSAVLLLTNFGERHAAHRRRGARSGGCCPARTTRRSRPAGSCIGVVVTDAPVDRRRLRPARAPDRARPGPHRLDRAPRQRRDLPRRLDGLPHGPRRRRPTARTRIAGRALDAAVRGGRRRGRGGGAELDARRRRRPSAATATPARGSTADTVARLLREHGRAGHSSASVRITMRRRRPARRDALPARSRATVRSPACSRRCPTARTT